MPTFTPTEQIVDAHKLNADGYVELYEMSPGRGSGTIYLKADNPVTWRTKDYVGLPLTLSGEKHTADGSNPLPRLQIGQEQVNLLPFKGLIHDGDLDGGRIVRYEILLQDLLANRDVKRATYFRIKRVEGYSTTQITLQLATEAGAVGQTVPHRQYVPPHFPWVNI